MEHFKNNYKLPRERVLTHYTIFTNTLSNMYELGIISIEQYCKLQETLSNWKEKNI